jgi:hypothetical protein
MLLNTLRPLGAVHGPAALLKAGLARAAVAAALTAAMAAPALAQTAGASPAKKELIARVLELQRPAIEAIARSMAEQPAAQVMQQVAPFLQQRVAADKREVLAREIEADIRKYIEEVAPLARDRAIKLAPSTLGVTLDERMDEAELRQLVAALETPAFRKFEQISGDAQRSFVPKLVGDLRPTLEPKIRAMNETVAKRLGVTPPAGAASAPAGGAAAPAPKK